MTPGAAPTFSVIVPCFNSGPFLEECLDSIRSQTQQPLEIIVVDDGSTDPDTIARLDALCVEPIRLIRQQNAGPAAARNAAVAVASGEWIVPLDADDRLRTDALESFARAIATDPSVDVWYPWVQHIGNDETLWETPEFNGWRELWDNHVIGAGSAIHRRVFDSGVRYNVQMRGGYEDWEFYIHALCEKGFRARVLKRPLLYYRRWGYSRNTQANEMAARLIQQLHLERPIFGDEQRLLELKRQCAPFFAISSSSASFRTALSTQTFTDFRVVDATGQVQRDQDLAIFRQGLGRALFVSRDDVALGRALEQDPYLLEKMARVWSAKNPSMMWLVTLDDADGAYPGFILDPDQANRSPHRMVGWIVSLKHLFEHPQVPARTDQLHNDLALHFERHVPGSLLSLIVGVTTPGTEEVTVPATKSPGDLQRPGRERLLALKGSMSQLVRAVAGPSVHEQLRDLKHAKSSALRERLKNVDAALPLTRGRVMRASPISPEHQEDSSERNRIAYVADQAPRFSELAPPPTPALMVLAPWIIHGGVDRSIADLLQGLSREAPGLRKYLVTTLPAQMAWASEVIPYVHGVFSLPDMETQDPSGFLAGLSERLGVDTVLIANSQAGYDALPAFRALRRRPRVVAQLHGFHFDPETGKLDGYPNYAASRYDNLIDAYAPISTFIAQRLTDTLYVSPTRVKTVRIGMDVARFAQARRERFTAPTSSVLWLGRLSTEKGPDMVPRIAAAWKAKHGSDRLTFTIAGNGPEHETVRNLIARLRVKDIVQMVGAVSDPLSLYKRADCLLMTSHYEGVPLVIYEAMAAGLPVVASTRNTSIGEVLSPKHAEFIQKQDDPEAYVAALERMIEDPVRTRTAAQEVADASWQYDLSRYTAEMLELLYPGGLSVAGEVTPLVRRTGSARGRS